MTNEEKLTKLQELESILKVHDFYFRMSDDHRWWEKGMSEEIKIDKLVNELGQEGQELRGKYNPSLHKRN